MEARNHPKKHTGNAKERPSRGAAESAVRTLIQWAGDDPDREGLRGTPARVVRAYEEWFAGYFDDPREYLQRTFEEVAGYDEMVLLRDIRFESHCEHHMISGACPDTTSTNCFRKKGFMPTYAIRQLHLPQSLAFTATLIGGLLLTVGAPLFGHMSDRVGRVRMMVIVSALFAVSAYPSFLLLVANPSLAGIVGLVCWLSLLKAAYSGTLPALMAELFPTATRSSGIAVAYNTSVPIFGGTAPLIATWLVATTGSQVAPSYYLIATAVLSLLVLIVIHMRVKTI